MSTTKYYNSYTELINDTPEAGTTGIVEPQSLSMVYDGTSWSSASTTSSSSTSQEIKDLVASNDTKLDTIIELLENGSAAPSDPPTFEVTGVSIENNAAGDATLHVTASSGSITSDTDYNFNFQIAGNCPTIYGAEYHPSSEAVVISSGQWIESAITFSALPEVNITSDKLLSGCSAINSNGEVVNGSIDTVVATKNGSTVTVPVGYIAERQVITVESSGSGETPTETTAVITYNFLGISSEAEDPDSSSATVVCAVAVEEPGYVTGDWGAEWTQEVSAVPQTEYTPSTEDIYIVRDRWLNGDQIIKGDANLVAANIKNGVTIFGVTGSYSGSGGGVTGTPEYQLQEVTIQRDGAGSTSINVYATPGVITEETTLSFDFQICDHCTTVSEGDYYPSTTDQTIERGQWIENDIIIHGDSNLVPANIKSGVSIFGVTGSFVGTGSDAGTGGGGGMLVKVTKYAVAQDAYTRIDEVTVSGFGSQEENWEEGLYGYDYTDYNGTYHRFDAVGDVLKHVNKNLYLFRVTWGDEKYWVFDSSHYSEISSDYYIEGAAYSSSLTSGSWTCNYDIPAQNLTINKTESEVPAKPEELVCVYATPNGTDWDLGGAAPITTYDKCPRMRGIYLTSGNRLLGDPIAFHLTTEERYMPMDGLLFYAPLDDAASGSSVDVVGGVILIPDTSDASSKALTASESGPRGGTCWKGSSEARSGLVGFKTDEELPLSWTLSAYVKVNDSRSSANGNTHLVDFGARNGAGFGLRSEYYQDGEVRFCPRYKNDEDIDTRHYRNDDESRGDAASFYSPQTWVHVVITFDENSREIREYINGRLTCNSDGNINTVYASEVSFGNRDSAIQLLGRPVEYSLAERGAEASICEVMVWDRVLTAAERAQLSVL